MRKGVAAFGMRAGDARLIASIKRSVHLDEVLGCKVECIDGERSMI